MPDLRVRYGDTSPVGNRPALFRIPDAQTHCGASRAVIVHNPAAAAMVKAHAPEAAVHEIPHLFERPTLPPGYEVDRLRASLGVRGSTFLFGVFGHLRESKRLAPILRAFEVIRGSCEARRFSSPASSRQAIWRERRGRSSIIPALLEWATCPTRISGAMRRRWTPASICDTRPRGKPPE